MRPGCLVETEPLPSKNGGLNFRSQASNLRANEDRKFITIFYVWLASLALGQAATQLPLTIETLADKAEAVVHGKVTGMICKRDATGRIFTEVQLKLTETLKGKPSGEEFRLVPRRRHPWRETITLGG